MTKVLVICPMCGKTLVAHGKVSFYHCGTAFLIKNCANMTIMDKIASNFDKTDEPSKIIKEAVKKEREVNAGQDTAELCREGAQELGESANPDNSELVSGRADNPSEGSAETGAETEQLSVKKPSEGDHA